MLKELSGSGNIYGGNGRTTLWVGTWFFCLSGPPPINPISSPSLPPFCNLQKNLIYKLSQFVGLKHCLFLSSLMLPDRLILFIPANTDPFYPKNLLFTGPVLRLFFLFLLWSGLFRNIKWKFSDVSWLHCVREVSVKVSSSFASLRIIPGCWGGSVALLTVCCSLATSYPLHTKRREGFICFSFSSQGQSVWMQI